MNETVVDKEIKVRMGNGFRRKYGTEISDTELEDLLGYFKFSGKHPLVDTFDEVEEGVERVVQRVRGLMNKGKGKGKGTKGI